MDRFTYDSDTGLFYRKYKQGHTKRVGGIISKGYIGIPFKGKMISAHRLAYYCMNGEWPLLKMDHINGVRDDNRWINLRMVSDSQNRINAITKTGVSGLRGVSWSKQSNRWRVRIQVGRKRIGLGFYKDKEIAYRKYVEASAIYHGPFSCLARE